MKDKFDFSGWATKVDLKCADGRVIRKDAFKGNDGMTVPLVWQHLHNQPSNVLGHALLENRDEGVYAYCAFNDSTAAGDAKIAVKHGDIKSLSIFANDLSQKGSDVVHGTIREVSLVLSGANPGAVIENLTISHGDGTFDDTDEAAIIKMNLPLSFDNVEEEDEEVIEHADGEKTVQQIVEEMTDEQKTVLFALLAAVSDGELEQSGINEEGEDENLSHSNEGDNTLMHKNIFDKESGAKARKSISHDQFKALMADAQRRGSFAEAWATFAADNEELAHAGGFTDGYGIENIDYLFPDAQSVTPTPTFIQRDMSWVRGVLNGVRHSRFARIKSLAADITPDTARALGYVTGALKKEEVFELLRRITTPTTVYKKQKFDRDDIIDIVDIDVVRWVKGEMRMMLDEELARAILVGDGRDVASEDKINASNIRPIYTDDTSMYVHQCRVAYNSDADAQIVDAIEAIIRARKYYKGAGSPTLYVNQDFLTDMLLLKDTTGHRLYKTEQELAATLRVSNIVEVPVMDNLSRESTDTTPVTMWLKGIIVNLTDYVAGADRGGEVTMFDDFDIDYNQYKYLLETRMSGALVQPKSAIVIEIDDEAVV